MGDFIISEQFRLEIRWNSIDYNREGRTVLNGCYLTGPAVAQVELINNDDHIDLDFVGQFIIFINNYYIIRLSWNEVRIDGNKIFLSNATLENRFINVVPKLCNSDYIVVDTSNHQPETHHNYFNYRAYLVNENGQYYSFR